MKDAEAIMSALLAAAVLGAKQDKDKDKESPEIDGDKIRKQSKDLGNAYYHIYLGFKDAGFNDTQAFQLVLTTIGRN